MSNIETLVDFIRNNKKDLQICHTVCDAITAHIPPLGVSESNVEWGSDNAFTLVKLCLGKNVYSENGSIIRDKYISTDCARNIGYNILKPGYLYEFSFEEYNLAVLYDTDKIYFLDSYFERCENGKATVDNFRIQETTKSQLVDFLNTVLGGYTREEKNIDSYCEFVAPGNDYFRKLVEDHPEYYFSSMIDIAKIKTDFKLDYDFLIKNLITYITDKNSNVLEFYDFSDYNNDDDDFNDHNRYEVLKLYKDANDKFYDDIYPCIENTVHKLQILLRSLDRLTFYKHSDLLKDIKEEILQIFSNVDNMSAFTFEDLILSQLYRLKTIVNVE